jgi:hypothetical protein
VSVAKRVSESVRAVLLAVSAYAFASRPGDLDLDDPNVERMREQLGGQLQPPPTTRTRWYQRDVESAEYLADQGDLSLAAQLMRAANRDGVLAGVLSTRTDGLVRLPKRFQGAPEMVDDLQSGGTSARSVFDEMFPAAELARLAADGIELGVGVGELVPVPGRAHPVLVRLDPQFLTYRWSENRWYYRSVAGLLAIKPGDGRWILHTPGGRMAPWLAGLWRCLGRAYVRKEHANELKDSWESKLANPARVAISPQAASEDHKQSWFRKVMAWGVNSVFGLTAGYDVKLLESNGRGADSFVKTIADCNQEFTVALAGQTVTTTGGAGFQNSDVHRTIRGDLIQATAEGLAHTVNTQGLPAYVVCVWGEDRLDEVPTMGWDVTPPKDREAEARALLTTATAIKAMVEALELRGLEPDVEAICRDAGVPLKRIEASNENAKPKLELVRGAA